MDDHDARAWVAFYRSVLNVRRRCAARPLAPDAHVARRLRARAAKRAKAARVVPAKPNPYREAAGLKRRDGAKWCPNRKRWVLPSRTSPL